MTAKCGIASSLPPTGWLQSEWEGLYAEQIPDADVRLLPLGGVSIATAESPLNANASMHDNLLAAMVTKKPVTVVLKNGQTHRAPIGSVADHLIVLSGPSQKEYYDVLVVIDEIVAVEFRAREQ